MNLWMVFLRNKYMEQDVINIQFYSGVLVTGTLYGTNQEELVRSEIDVIFL